MEEKNADDSQTTEQVNQSQHPKYVPSALERKRAMLMYILFGVIATILTRKVSVYEFYHVKQATWWRAIMVLFCVVAFVLFFIPILKILPILCSICLIWIRWICVKQARDGVYIESSQKSFLSIFVSLGNRLFEIFDMQFTLITEE